MARQRSFRRGFRTINGRKRHHIWIREVNAATLATGTVDHVDALAVFEGLLGSELLGATVAVNHLDYMVLDDGTLEGAPDQVTIGARIFTQSTLTQLTVAQGPFTDHSADWFVYQPVIVSSEPCHECKHFRVELASSRRLDELGQSLLISTENQASGAISFRWAATIGVLLP